MQARRPDREFVGFRPEQAALDADPVAEVEQLEDLEVERRQGVLADVHLDPGEAVGKDQKVRLPEGPDREDAAARLRFDAFGFELVMAALAVLS